MKDILYRYLIGKDRREIQEEARKQGYEQGVIDERERNDHNKNMYQLLAQEWFVQPEDVFIVNPQGNMFLGGNEMTKTEISNLQGEIKFIERSQLWKIMQETLRQKAIEKSVLNSTEWEQVLAGKMMIHSLGIFKSVMVLLKNYKIK